MPGFDGTGPRGRGPMTGRGEGNCAMPADEYDDIPRGYGYGRGWGRGRGRGWGRRGRGYGRGWGRGYGRGRRHRWGRRRY